jgi:hypothetical protein
MLNDDNLGNRLRPGLGDVKESTNLMFKSTKRPTTEGIGTLVGTRNGLFLGGHYWGDGGHGGERSGGYARGKRKE